MYFRRRFAICSIIIISFILATFISGCGILPEEEAALAPPLVQSKREEYQLYKAARKDITKFVKGVGSFEPAEKVDTFFHESGKRLSSIDVKYGQMVKKGTVVVRADNGDLESRIKLKEIDVSKLKIQLAELKDEYNTYMALPVGSRPAPKDIEDLQVRIKLMQLDMEAANIQLDDLSKEQGESVLTAPIDGQVVFIEDVKSGDVVDAYKTLVTIADPSNLQIYCQSSNVILVKTGMKAELTFDGKKYEGKVVISPDNIPSGSGKRYENAIVVKSSKVIEGAKLGSTVDISIPIESHKNVVVIPKNGLQRAFGIPIIRIMDGDSKKEFNVETGIETDTEIEITSGLEEGQMVIVN
jgi:RND family efflux transporter MFP subunit